MAAFCKQSVLWTSGNEDYHTYRIPALIVTPAGTVLAFCEGRRNSSSDTGDIDMLVKRSTDGGRSWSNHEMVWDDGENACGNPCAVVDRETGDIWLLMTHNLGTDREAQIIDQTSEGTRTVWVVVSKDDGRSWSTPYDITSTTKRPDWTWFATGPGNGIQLASGRLLIPCDHIEADTNRYYSHVIYSDDHGKSWQLGGSTLKDFVNECCIAELENGDVLLNMRNYAPEKRTRQIAMSTDSGLTWSEQWHDDVLIEPICQASLISIPGAKNHLLFSNPASRDSRTNMTIRHSTDGGRTWVFTRTLHPGFSEYSSLVVLPDHTIGCLYEYGRKKRNEHLMLTRFDTDWIKDGR